MLTRKAATMPGADSAKLSQSKNEALTRSHPGELTTTRAISAKTTTVEMTAIST